jgi:hypothetical protein
MTSAGITSVPENGKPDTRNGHDSVVEVNDEAEVEGVKVCLVVKLEEVKVYLGNRDILLFDSQGCESNILVLSALCTCAVN